jgi:hypothetical protein
MENTMEKQYQLMMKEINENRDRSVVLKNPKDFFIEVVRQKYEDEVYEVENIISKYLIFFFSLIK